MFKAPDASALASKWLAQNFAKTIMYGIHAAQLASISLW